LALHLASCSKNVKKCHICGKAFEIGKLEEHIKSSQGNRNEILQAIESADIEKLRDIDRHLEDTNINNKFLEGNTENTLNNSVLHHIISNC
jgi:hypothetical protein